jgi:hypothetical protein
MSFFGNSLTDDAKDTEEAIKERHVAENKLTQAMKTGDAEAIKIADYELKMAIKNLFHQEAYEVTGHTIPGYEPLNETLKHIKADIASARSGGYPLSALYIEKLQPAYDKGQLSSGLSELVKDAIAKQTKEGGRRYKSKKYKRTSKKHERTSKKHKRTSKRHK